MLRDMLGDRQLRSAAYPMLPLTDVAAVSYGLQKSPANRPGLTKRSAFVAWFEGIDKPKRTHVIVGYIYHLDISKIEPTALNVRNSQIRPGKARPDRLRLLPDFAMAWFNTETGRAHFFNAGKTTSGLGTINSSVVRGAPIPLPPLSDQERLVAELDVSLISAMAKRSQAQALRSSAWAVFETSVFQH